MIPRSRIGRKADARLVTQRVVRKDSTLLNDLEERQHEVSRNPKDFMSAVTSKPAARMWLVLVYRLAYNGDVVRQTPAQLAVFQGGPIHTGFNSPLRILTFSPRKVESINPSNRSL